jgi:hypothetical protein
MSYTEHRSKTEIVCFELDEKACAGMTDEQIIAKYGKELTCAEADGGMVEPDSESDGWYQTSLELDDFELASPHDVIYRTEKPTWVAEICDKTQTDDNDGSEEE